MTSSGARARHHVGDVPYAIAVVKLRDGASLISASTAIPLERLTVGLPVGFRPLEIVTESQTTLGFSLA